MNILRLSTLSLTLAIAFVTLGYMDSASADPKNWDGDHCVDHGGDGGGDDDKTLRAKFDLFIGTTGPQYILSDNGSYPNSNKDHVQVGTGSGPGFRFDTNTQNVSNLSRWMSARFVFMTVAVDTPTTLTLPYEIDFRFNQRIGLDLGSLDVGASGTVAASLQYFGGNQVVGFDALNNGILGFGALNANTIDEASTCLAAAGMIKVTRNTDTKWTLESVGGSACRFAIDANGDIECSHSPCGNQPTIIAFKFKFTINEQV